MKYQPIIALLSIEASNGSIFDVTNHPGGVMLGNRFFADLLIGFPEILLSTQNPPDLLESDIREYRLIDKRGAIRALDKDFTLAGRPVNSWFGPAGKPWDTHFRGAARGRADALETDPDNGIAVLHVQDEAFPMLSAQIEGTIFDTEYENLPAQPEQTFKNIVFGNKTRQSEGLGAILAPEVDTVARARHAGQHAFKSIDQVYDSNWPANEDAFPGNGGLLVLDTHYAIEEVTDGSGNVTDTLIVLNQDGHGPITFNAQGVTDDNTSSGNLIDSPVEAIEWLLLRAGLTSADIEAITRDAVKAAIAAQGRTIKGFIDDRITYREAIRQIAVSFNIELPAFMSPATGDRPVTIGFAYPDVEAITAATPVRSDLKHIVRGSFRELRPEKVVSRIKFEYGWCYDSETRSKKFMGMDEIEDEDLSGTLHRAEDESLRIRFDDVQAAALATATRRLLFLRPANKHVEIEQLIADNQEADGSIAVQPSRHLVIDHPGYTEAVADVAGAEPLYCQRVEMDLERQTLKIRAKVYALLLASVLWLGDGNLVTNDYGQASDFERSLYAYLTDADASTETPGKTFLTGYSSPGDAVFYTPSMTWHHRQNLVNALLSRAVKNLRYVRNGAHWVRGEIVSGLFGTAGPNSSAATFATAKPTAADKVKIWVNGRRLGPSRFSRDSSRQITLSLGFELSPDDEIVLDYIIAAAA